MTERILARRTAAAELRDEIVRQIHGGQLRPGDALRSTNELAKDYRIAYVTAHKAIRQLAAEGYCVRINGRGTFVSDNPTPARISAVGIPAHNQANPFLAHMIEELTLQAAVRGIKAIVGRAETTEAFVERLVQNGVRAMIRFPGCYENERRDERDTWRLLRERNIATVIINNFWYEDGPFPTVCTDEEAGIMEMVGHLASLGHKRILFVDELVKDARFRAIQAYRKALWTHGLPFDPRNVICLFPAWENSREAVIRQMLDQGTAALVIYDLYAVEIAEEFRRMGVALGREFSLAGFDGTHEAEVCGLSTVVQPLPELVSTAYSLLEDGPQREPRRIELKPSCVFRETTGPAPAQG